MFEVFVIVLSECIVSSGAHPPASAKSGNTADAAEIFEASSTTGSVVIRKSDRSFRRPRRATAATGFEELNVIEPAKLEDPLKGSSSRNPAICPLAGMLVVPASTSCQFESVKKKDTVAASSFGFARASPLLTALVL